jgi:MFS family permease
LVGVGLAGAGDFSNSLLILWATQAWIEELGNAAAIERAMLFYAGYNVVYTVSCYASGWLADRVPKHVLLAGGYSLAVVPALMLLAPGNSLVKFAIIFGVSGLYMGIWETVESSAAAETLPKHVRGFGFGALATVNGVGDFISSTTVGLLWAHSPQTAMGYVVVTSLAGAALILMAGRRRAQKTAEG